MPHTPTASHPARLTALAAALTVVLTGCGIFEGDPAPTSDHEVVSEASLNPGDRIPAPTGPVVLTISGQIAVPGGDNTVELDMDTLESVGLVRYTVMDRQAEGGRATFDGVLLSDLLAVLGASEATALDATAVNDYTVQIPVSDAHAYPVMIATVVDGQRMDVERYGPLRVVYPTEGYDLDPVVYEPRWIWQLTSVQVW
jgi:hypothetical protein